MTGLLDPPIVRVLTVRSTEYGIYVADDWRATQKLTLNLGLRYELDTPPTEQSNQWASFDPATATVLVAGGNGVSETARVKTFMKAFAPRLGFAYQVAQHTVVRGGAGIFWNTAGHGGNALRLQRHVPFGPICHRVELCAAVRRRARQTRLKRVDTVELPAAQHVSRRATAAQPLSAPMVNTGTGSRPDRIGDGTLSNPTVDRWFDTSLQHSSIRSAERSHRRGQCRNDYQHRRHAQKHPFCAQPANRVAGLIEVYLDAARLCRGRLPARERLRR